MSDREQVDPWARWSWVMGAIWLFFLIFPVSALLSSSYDAPLRLLGLSCIAVFAVVYVVGFVQLGRIQPSPSAPCTAWSAWTLVVLVALAAVVLVLVGTEGLGMLIYVVAFSMFALPLRAGFVVAGLALTGCLVLPVASDDFDEALSVVPILLLVTAGLVITRVLTERGDAYQDLRRDLDLVAERERVARDVHDVLGHSLTVVTAKAELAERLVDLDPERAKDELAQIRSLTREALAEIRATVSGLRIARLGDELASAQAVLADAGIAADVPHDASVVDPRHRLTLAWVLREAVTNVVRHSGASRCEVHLAPAGLRVVDDGVGHDDAPPGNGLRGITERVCAAGGELRWGTGPDRRGSELEVRW